MFVKAIETAYKGYRFRSRLEARWAVFFDALKISWVYEIQGFDLPSGRYLPDFWVSTNHSEFHNAGYWVEIKSNGWCESTSKTLARMGELTDSTKHTSHILIGDPGDFLKLVYHHKTRKWIVSTRCDLCDWLPDVERNEFFAYCLATQYSSFVGAEKITAAIRAARSARFEFGETPCLK